MIILLSAALCSPLMVDGDTGIRGLSDEISDVKFTSNSINATISPISGDIAGGDQITITGSGFSNMAYHNVTEDGLSHTWSTSTVDYIQGGYGDQAIATTSNGDIDLGHFITSFL